MNMRSFDDIDNIYAEDIDANLIPSDLYQSSDAPAAGSEYKANCGGKISRQSVRNAKG